MELSLNLDCGQLKSFDASLYTRLVNYPVEMIPICDEAAQHVANALFPGAQDWSAGLKTRTFNLAQDNRLRDLDPMDIDKLISVRGMVTRCSPVIPDLKAGFFACTTCGSSQTAAVDRGAIAEPQLCTNRECQAAVACACCTTAAGSWTSRSCGCRRRPSTCPRARRRRRCRCARGPARGRRQAGRSRRGHRHLPRDAGARQPAPPHVPQHLQDVRRHDPRAQAGQGARVEDELDSADGVDSTATAEHQVEFSRRADEGRGRRAPRERVYRRGGGGGYGARGGGRGCGGCGEGEGVVR